MPVRHVCAVHLLLLLLAVGPTQLSFDASCCSALIAGQVVTCGCCKGAIQHTCCCSFYCQAYLHTSTDTYMIRFLLPSTLRALATTRRSCVPCEGVTTTPPFASCSHFIPCLSVDSIFLLLYFVAFVYALLCGWSNFITCASHTHSLLLYQIHSITRTALVQWPQCDECS